ncbi:non-ribosomal peptide synthetase [Streptomyces yaizuensis]|uniref:Amino acid adenylation domain-containing protein n=1 Tax=Streptomyces yaizuensis TaxID=2989713 RepID=A0ABQ5NQP4_9ACTN|nr:amino acid adenylation domain-containing protein [Streptomyces sp. YSPA8]GLF92674.1 amino acid adenylation domain-containing protein [Streptomyces sp. YSPA8]
MSRTSTTRATRTIEEATGVGEIRALPPIQRPLWTASRITQDLPVYTEAEGFRLTGPVDRPALIRALDALYARHPALRTVVTEDADGRPRVRVLPGDPFPLTELDLRGHGAERAAALAEQAATEAARTVFDLETGPLARARLIRCDEEEWLLVLVLHHLVCDGDSFRTLFAELGALYAGDALPAPHPDPIGAQARLREEAGEEQIRADLDHWHGRLTGLPTHSAGHAPGEDPGHVGHRGGRCPVPLDEDWFDRVRATAAAARVSPFAVVASALSVVLSRFTRGDDVLLGTTVNMRADADAEDAVGYFMKTVPLRLRIDESAPAADLLRQTQEAVLDAMEHTAVEFDEILAGLDRVGDAHTPVFRSALELHYAPSVLRLPGVSARPLPLDPGTAKFDVSFHLAAAPGALSFVEYRTGVYDAATAEALAGAFRTLLDGVCAAEDPTLEQLPLVDPEESAPGAATAGDGPAGPAPGRCLVPLPDAVRERAALHPDRPALVLGADVIGYEEFVRRADRVGAAVAAAGAGPGDVVGVAVRRSPDQTCALFGVWSAGAACAPLDPALPAERLGTMMRAAGIRVVVTDEGAEGSPAFSGVRTVSLRDHGSPGHETAPGGPPAAKVTPEDVAYVIFTSGTTGVPKPVAVRHLSLAAFGPAMDRLAFGELPEPSRVAVNAPFSFDAFWQNTQLLRSGHTLHPVPDEVRADPEAMVGFLRDHAIDVLDGTPTHIVSLVDAGLLDGAAHVPSCLLLGGEAVPPALWRRLAAARTRAFNVYGPTEFTVNATGGRIEDTGARPTIGRPLAGVTARVLDARRRPVPVGFPGELHLSGPQLAVGYLGRPDLTAERFHRAPDGTRGYATGDVVRVLDGGNLEFLGRADDQVKLRGHRIEPGEITTVLRSVPGVADAAVVLVRPGTPTAALHAALVLTDPAAGPDPVRAVAVARLPAYMMPSSFAVLPRLPRTTAGKLDRAALVAGAETDGLRTDTPSREAGGAGEGHEVPEVRGIQGTPGVQGRLASLWARLLCRETVTAGDDFFALGGNSLLASRLVREVRAEFGIRLPLGAVFGRRTLAAMAEALEAGPAQEGRDGAPAAADGLVVPLTGGAAAGGDPAPLVMFHPLGGTLYSYQPLLGLLPDTTAVWGVRSPTAAEAGPEAPDVASLAARYADEVVRRVPAPRLTLFGWSLGGLIALAVAAELEARGVRIDFAEIWDCGVGTEEPPGDREPLRLALRAAYGPEALLRHAPLVGRILAGVAEGERIDAASVRSVQERTRALGTAADNDALPRHLRVIRHQTELFREWEPLPLHLPLHAVYAGPSLRDGSVPRTDWGRFTSGPWTEATVDADHYAMMRPPGLGDTARGLLARLAARAPRKG